MIDIHCHLLPNIDDGPQSMTESLELATIAIKNNIQKAIVTPHIHPGRYENDFYSIFSSYAMFKSKLIENNLSLEIGMAAEVRIAPEIIPMLKRYQIPFLGELAGYKVLLLELPHSHIPPGSDKLVRLLLDQGIRPMIAHPERNKDVMHNLNCILPFVKMGCLLQVTASSVSGYFGKVCQKRANEMLSQNWVSVLASDAHNKRHRPPELLSGYQAAARIIGADAAKNLVYSTPLSIVKKHFT